MGAYRDGAFHADEMILKCPSKYIKEPPVPARAGTDPGPPATLAKGA
jgi:hypothetical protein